MTVWSALKWVTMAPCGIVQMHAHCEGEAVLSTDGLLDAEEQSGDFGNWLEQDKPQGKIKRDYSSYD